MANNWFFRLCEELYNIFVKRGRAVRFEIILESAWLSSKTSRGEFMKTISVIQQVPASAQPVDAKGNPVSTTFAAPPSWASSDSTVLSLSPAADGLSAVVTAVGKIGTATISVVGTPQGQPNSISGSVDVEVTAAPAVSFVLSFGAATDQGPLAPPAPPPPPPPGV